MTSGRRKKIVIAGVVLLCVAGLFAVAQIYASYTDRNERAIYTGTYVLGEIEGTGEQVTIHYDGENYPGKKIDDVPNIVNNGKAAAMFDKHYK